jgi:HPt (histidine-containing phosphotransfer) domain-containing protein
MAQYINLEYLNSSSKDAGFTKKMIELFLETMPPVMENINETVVNTDLIGLGKSAHQAKSSVLIVGLENLSAMFREMELEAKAGNKEKDYQHLYGECKIIFDAAILELHEVLKNM